ncbi:UvrD-helicase domain-containing protein [Lederbergia citrea]|uniref:UvrD-helicase domain-containing protein n=1 Tax=Lederbergia citrea TaxID=2833581 RepID=UPI001BCA52A8|nr:ATP-dependent helicase [Lederbergia citrea]MBS4203522.1 ATP-dependent helicase [Lederbergia citrea]
MSNEANEWIPSKDIVLEDAALLAIKYPENIAIAAGPGAGKTELLAHKAGYLIETNICPYPKKILAISFKSDAARNLQERVQKRYGKDVVRRFESKTFDAFSKGLLEQFLNALPKKYKPNKDYEIILNERNIDDIVKGYIKETNVHYNNWQYEYNFNQLMRTLKSSNLPLVSFDNDLYSWINNRLWNVLIKGKGNLKSSLTFPMISILVEYLLSQNPLIVNALRATYSHVFLDEFQDTTDLQYNLLKTFFLGSDTILTAVGDNKQRIMGWAGALPNAFEVFTSEFNAQQSTLLCNFRSAPKLVYIQNVFSQTLNNQSVEVQAAGNWNEDDGICEVWNFENHVSEANILARSISEWIEEEQLTPKDFCIIVKQQEDIYASAIITELSKLNIQSRIEKDYQDLLSEEIIILLIKILELTYKEKSPELWLNVIEEIIEIKYGDLDVQSLNYMSIEQELVNLLSIIKVCFANIDESNFNVNFESILRRIIDYLDEDIIKSIYPKYNQGNYLNLLIEKMISKLNYTDGISVKEMVCDFIGEYSIPIMTIHKSKGLEYHTVIFIGVEDKAFWSFSTQKEADKNAFFVALSRAKERIIFTVSNEREISRYGRIENTRQTTSNISELLQTLNDAGVLTINKKTQLKVYKMYVLVYIDF